MTSSDAALLDSNIMIALAVTDHRHHRAAEDWLTTRPGAFATCPITQGALLRVVSRAAGSSPAHAVRLLARIVADRRHEFWGDDVSYLDVRMDRLIGHQQLTDAYLAQLARHRGGRLATFDGGLAALHPDVAELVPTS